jgi:hypothetical protein
MHHFLYAETNERVSADLLSRKCRVSECSICLKTVSRGAVTAHNELSLTALMLRHTANRPRTSLLFLKNCYNTVAPLFVSHDFSSCVTLTHKEIISCNPIITCSLTSVVMFRCCHNVHLLQSNSRSRYSVTYLPTNQPTNQRSN